MPTAVLNVLLVEDNELVSKLTAAMLARGGHNVVVARSAEEALALEREGNPIDLLLVDLVLGPGLNGYALIEQITERRLGLRVIVASGRADPATLPPIPDAKSVAFLPKPYSEQQLLAAVDNLP